MRRAHASSITIASLLAVLPACDSCHGSKPYTPYTLTDTPPAPSAPVGASSAGSGPGLPPDGGPAFAVVAATPAPEGGARWPLGDGFVEAPPGHVFAQGLVLD